VLRQFASLEPFAGPGTGPCKNPANHVTPRARPRRRRKTNGLFAGYWIDPVTGRRLGRATRRDIAEAYRLRSKHADVLKRGSRAA
jgi:hypothetical protein